MTHRTNVDTQPHPSYKKNNTMMHSTARLLALTDQSTTKRPWQSTILYASNEDALALKHPDLGCNRGLFLQLLVVAPLF